MKPIPCRRARRESDPLAAAVSAMMVAALLLWPAVAAVADEGLSFFEEPESGTGPVRLGGSVGLVTRSIIDTDSPWASPVTVDPVVLAEVRVDGASTEAVARIRLDGRRGFDDSRDVVEEAWVRLYANRFTLQVGSFKTVWGSGDGVHVVDVLNPFDYTDFVNPRDYIDRKLAHPMALFTIPTGREAALQLALSPTFAPDRIPLEGPWAPAEVVALRSELAGLNALPGIDLNAGEQDQLVRALFAKYDAAGRRLDHTQLGARFTARGAGVDYGLTYHWGFFPTPWIDQSAVIAAATAYDASGAIDNDTLAAAVRFNRRHLVGVDASAAVGALTLRAEAAYLLSEDFAGSDPSVQNHRVTWMAGADRSLGFSNAALNVQLQGEAILRSNRIAQPIPGAPVDIDVDPQGDYRRHTVVARLSDRWRNDRVRPELVLIHLWEEEAGAVRPAVEFRLRDDVELIVRGSLFYGGRDTQFGRFRDDGFVEVAFGYAF